MSDRFIIDCYGIIDTSKELTGKCEDDKLSWRELCGVLNELDEENERLKQMNKELVFIIKESARMNAEILNKWWE